MDVQVIREGGFDTRGRLFFSDFSFYIFYVEKNVEKNVQKDVEKKKLKSEVRFEVGKYLQKFEI